MNAANEHRRTVRLHIDSGVALLRHEDCPAIGCTLDDLSETGCRCLASEPTVGAVEFQAWSTLLLPGVRLEVEISKPPQISRQLFKAAVAHQHSVGRGFELGLVFTELSQTQAECLRGAMMSIAAEKIRHAHPEPAIHPTPAEHPSPVPGPAHAVEPAGVPSVVEVVRKPPPSALRPVSHSPLPHASAAVPEDGKRESFHGKSLGEVLVRLQLLTREQVAAAEAAAQQSRAAFTRYAIQQHLVGPGDMCRALSLQTGMPVTHLNGVDIPHQLTRMFTYLTMLRHEFVPFTSSREILCIAAAAPLGEAARAELSRVCPKDIMIFLAPLDQIRSQLFRLRPRPAYKERESNRTSAALPVAVQYCDSHGVNLDEAIHEGEVVDLSEGGFLIGAPAPEALAAEELLEAKACVRLAVSLPGQEQEVHAVCRIRHIELRSSLEENQKRWHIGLQVAEIAPEDAQRLHDYYAKSTESHAYERYEGFTPRR